jgi:hypothetical protein
MQYSDEEWPALGTFSWLIDDGPWRSKPARTAARVWLAVQAHPFACAGREGIRRKCGLHCAVIKASVQWLMRRSWLRLPVRGELSSYGYAWAPHRKAVVATTQHPTPEQVWGFVASACWDGDYDEAAKKWHRVGSRLAYGVLRRLEADRQRLDDNDAWRQQTKARGEAFMARARAAAAAQAAAPSLASDAELAELCE